MLNRVMSRRSTLRILTLISPKPPSLNPRPFLNPNPTFPHHLLRRFSSTTNDDGRDTSSDVWRLSPDPDHSIDSIFGPDDCDGGVEDGEAGGGWGTEEKRDHDVFEGVDVSGREERGGGGGEGEWRLGGEEGDDDVFGVLEEREDGGRDEAEAIAKNVEEEEKLEEEAKMLSDVLKGPNRAFGDLISASGITEEMLDSLLALKDLGGVQGLPPLSEIEDMRYEKSTRKSSRAEIERQKQEDVAKARVRQVDDKGRAYGTGRRKCSIARVWIQPGSGKFVVNDKEFDVYFPMLDHRAALLRPFSETKTLGLWDVTCTVKGGGTSGQVGAVQLGVSRALQNWEPNLRPPLRAVGFLTRDARVVERKKPGQAKARKSFQWVKR